MRFGTKINLLLLIPVTIVLLIMMISAIPTVVINVLNWNSKIQTHIVAEEESNLLTRATITGTLVSTTFNRVTNDLKLASSYASQIQDMAIGSYYRKFNGGTPEVPPTPTSDWSAWFNHFDSNPNQFPLDNTTILDNVFRPLMRASSKYGGVYYGGSNSLFYHHKWFDQSHFPTLRYTCLRNNRETVGYDPTCRSWYIDANNNPSTVMFSPPYEDASFGDVLISPSVTIDSGVLSTDTGVIGADISMGTLESELLENTVLRNGYTILGDSRGNAVVYPDMKRDRVYTIAELEFTEDVSERSDFQTMYAAIFSGSSITGQITYTKTSALTNGTDLEEEKPDSRDWVLSYSKVTGTNYVVLMVVPKTDITYATDEIQNQSITGIIVGVVMLCVLLIVMIILALIINRKIAQRVTSPFARATAYTKDIGSGKLEAEMGDVVEHESPEFAELHDLLSQLMNAVRFGNAAYLNKDPARALQNYESVEKLLEKFKNNVGLGVVYNNKAVAYQDMGKFHEARECLNLAIQNAHDLIAKYTRKNDATAVSLYNIKLAERTMNYGRFYAAQYDVDLAEEQYQNSIAIHLTEDNILGVIHVHVNWGAMYMMKAKKGFSPYDPAKAFVHYDNAYKLACARHQKNPNSQNTEALQYAVVHLGMHHMEAVNYPTAMQMFHFALTLSKKMDRGLYNACLFKLADLYSMFGDHARSAGLRTQLNMAKKITFVLDCSGSMKSNDGGSVTRIDACRAAISGILSEQMCGPDTASLRTFDTEIYTVFENKNVDAERNSLLHSVAKNTEPGGRTAFYAAVQKSIEKSHSKSDIPQYFIALTDGADNESDKQYRMNHRTLQQCVKRAQANLIVITVGELSDNTMEEIQAVTQTASKTGIGLCISAENAGEIGKSFGKAMAQINAKANLEQL